MWQSGQLFHVRHDAPGLNNLEWRHWLRPGDPWLLVGQGPGGGDIMMDPFGGTHLVLLSFFSNLRAFSVQDDNAGGTS